MRARKCMGALALSGLMLAVSVNAAPRDGAAVGKTQARANALRQVTGTDAVLRDTASSGNVAQGCGTATLLVVPALAGTPCTFISGSGTSNATLTGNNCEFDVQVFISNFACLGEPVNTYQGSFGDFNTQFPVGISPPAGCDDGDLETPNECVRLDTAAPTINSGTIQACNTNTYTCGSSYIGTSISDDGSQYHSLIGHFHVNAGFTGSASLTLVDPGVSTFLIGANSGSTFPLEKIGDATINVPTGRCCDPAGCVEDVTQGACVSASLWAEGVLCPQNGGPPCAECPNGTNAECDDHDACTVDTCNGGTLLCNHAPKAGWTQGATNCCNPTNGNLSTLDDGDPCTDDTCSLSSSEGVAQHNPAADGSPCNDGNPCTATDVCTGGACAGTNVNGDTCTVDADCQNGGDTPGAICDGGACSCSLAVNVSFGVDPGTKEDPNCFAENDKVTVNVHLGASAVPLIGGQFYIFYDPSCLSYNSIQPTGVWPLELQQTVDENAGTIFWAGGVDLGNGGGGTFGNVDVATISFTKLGGCSSCNLCFEQQNPIHTRLTDNTGQSVQVELKCSKDIRTSPTVTISGPDSTEVNVACNSATRTVNWPAVSVSSDCENVGLTCTGTHVESGLDFSNLASTGGVFPVGHTNFCCDATSSCGNVDEHCWTVTVNDETCLDVELQLSPTMVTKPGGGITRCIKFEVFSNCVQPPLVFEDDMTFGGLFNLVGHFNGNVKIPSQVQPVCITARDQLHTLRGCYMFEPGDCRADGCMQATFKGDPFFGGNWLVGGNLDGWKKDNPDASHDVIDILDFGQLVSQWMTNYGTGDTPCGTEGPNADINGDGLVDILDFSFVSMNFLADSKDCCCPGSASLGNTQGRTSITVNELKREGMGDLSVADLNADGVVDLADMQALMQGARPQRQAPARDGKGADGSRSFNR